MTEDERAIRAVVSTWMSASKSGDTKTVLSLMTDDVLFMTPGQEPFGKEAFTKTSDAMKDARIEGTADIRELHVLDGGWAYIRSYIELTVTTPSAEPVHRAGYTLTILRKEADGRWRLCRDANLAMTVTG